MTHGLHVVQGAVVAWVQMMDVGPWISQKWAREIYCTPTLAMTAQGVGGTARGSRVRRRRLTVKSISSAIYIYDLMIVLVCGVGGGRVLGGSADGRSPCAFRVGARGMLVVCEVVALSGERGIPGAGYKPTGLRTDRCIGWRGRVSGGGGEAWVCDCDRGIRISAAIWGTHSYTRTKSSLEQSEGMAHRRREAGGFSWQYLFGLVAITANGAPAEHDEQTSRARVSEAVKTGSFLLAVVSQ